MKPSFVNCVLAIGMLEMGDGGKREEKLKVKILTK
jgi:hypothetical protein